jgi:hypothetical protein
MISGLQQMCSHRSTVTVGNINLAADLLLLANFREKHWQYNALGNIVGISAHWTWGCEGVEVTIRLAAW